MNDTTKPYDIPMIFSAPLVLANLAGLKTQTRRMPANNLRCAYEAQEAGRPIRLWMREAYRTQTEVINGKKMAVPYYKASSPYADPSLDSMRYKPSIHMPRWASRFTGLDVVITKECVQDITEADAMAEGVMMTNKFLDYVHGFSILWDSLHKHPKKPGQSWDENPEIFVLRYRGVPTNIDAEGCK